MSEYMCDDGSCSTVCTSEQWRNKDNCSKGWREYGAWLLVRDGAADGEVGDGGQELFGEEDVDEAFACCPDSVRSDCEGWRKHTKKMGILYGNC